MCKLRFDDAGHGYDAFGLSPRWVAATLHLLRPVYESYFRVSSHGIENVPADGPAILAPNHSGVIPIDALMLWTDVVRRTDPPRVPRAVSDHFVPLLPFVSLLFSRCGVVGGSRGNLHHLLERGELMMIFPEGTRGVGKPFSQRYQLQEWRVGHTEMAIRHRAPVVPVAIIGAEEQFPLEVRLPVHLFGAPYLPVGPVPFPLPVHYHIHYGPPIALHDGHPPEDADDPAITAAAAAQVKAAVQSLIETGLAQRKGWFR